MAEGNNFIKTDEEMWSEVTARYYKTDSLQLGKYYCSMIDTDIKHLAFTLSRYKFACKMLMYKKNVDLLELGCQEAMGALLFKQNMDLKHYVGVDLDQSAIQWNQSNLPKEFEFICGNFFEYNCKDENRGGRVIETEGFDAVVSLDVIEHISPTMENEFCEVVYTSLKEDGVAIIGTPNIALNPYASEGSKVGHINLYDQRRLYELMSKYFANVFIFNMNDEVVNTGFDPMSCYIFALCCNKNK